jgi:TolA-binding protein
VLIRYVYQYDVSHTSPFRAIHPSAGLVSAAICAKSRREGVGVSLERIEITPFAVIIGDVVQQRRTGQLAIVRAHTRKELYWSQGELSLITSSLPEDSLGDFLARRGVLTPERAKALMSGEPTGVVARFHESGLLELSVRQTLLREWLAAQFLPLFSLDEGTAAFTEEAALDPDKRVFLTSTAVLVLEGIRSITNGLVLRRSLGDLKREIAIAGDSRFEIDAIPLTDAERRVVLALERPMTLELLLKHFPNESVLAARAAITMLTLGIYGEVAYNSHHDEMANADEMLRDLEILAQIGSNDQRSLRAVGFSRQLPLMDHYQVLDVPRAANRTQILSAADARRRIYDPATYPVIVRDAITTIQKRIDEAVHTLSDASHRQSYDKLLARRTSGSFRTGEEVQRRMTQRSIAEQNFAKARELSVAGDYYGAIVLLRQAVKFVPEHAEAWYLLGSCQERNPKWRREAAESFQQALSIDPNHVDALISLGDLYRNEGLTSRAQSCYEDVLKIAPENPQAKSRLVALKKR